MTEQIDWAQVVYLGLKEMGYYYGDAPVGDGDDAPDTMPSYKVTTEYGVFNDAEVWEPLFAEGKLPENLRYMVDDPLHTGISLWRAFRFRELRNQERAEQDKMGTYGLTVIKKRSFVETDWTTVTHEEIDEVRR